MKDIYQSAFNFLRSEGLISGIEKNFYIYNERGDSIDLCGLIRDFVYKQNQRFIFARNTGIGDQAGRFFFLKKYNISGENFNISETENQREAIMCSSMEEAEGIKERFLCYLDGYEYNIVGINLDDLF